MDDATPLRVPRSDRGALELLAKLPAPAAEHLFEAVADAPPSLMPQDYVEQVAKRAPELGRAELEQIVEALLGAGAARSTQGVAVEEFAAGISMSQDLELDEDQRRELKARLTALWQHASLIVSSKALDVLTEGERTFHSARILTDVRPIFLDEPAATPAAAVVLHTLKVEFHSDDEIRSVFFVLNEDDLDDLEEVLSRARQKGASLRAIIESTRVAYLPVEPDASRSH